MDCSPPGFSVHRIFQARILEWIAIFFSSGSSWSRIWIRSPTLWAGSLPCQTQGNPINPCSLLKSRQLICGRTGTGIFLLIPGQFYFIKQYSHVLRVFDEMRMSDAEAMHKLWNNPNAIQWLMTCVSPTQWPCAIKSKNMMPNAFQK